MTRKIFLFEILLIAAALVASAILYPHLPAQVPMHWNLHFQPDRFDPKWTLFLFGPGFMAVVMLLTWVLPWLSPKRFEIDSFWRTYHMVMLLIFGIMTYSYAVILWADCGRVIDMGRVVFCGVCLFIILFGNLMGKLRRNFYLGIRTPWTLASERVWNATHRFAARITVAGGLVGLALSIAGLYLWALAAILLPALASVIYSLVYYKQLERRGEIENGLSREQGEP
ncbi:MAG TPA: SdpI family protein [Terracidiphilus sp.]|nr:SdpI family protein [Terracidiphilus sp.]